MRVRTRYGGYSGRWTQVEVNDFTRDWLAERIGHVFAPGANRCTHCGRKFGRNAGVLCPKRRKPNRWKLRLRRALRQAKGPEQLPVTRDPAWVLVQLAEIASEVKWLRPAVLDHPGFWKYHRLARRHRALLRLWWTFPTVPLPVDDSPLSGGASMGALTARRNRLLAKVLATGAPVQQDQGCTYTFYPHAAAVVKGKRIELFAGQEGLTP